MTIHVYPTPKMPNYASGQGDADNGNGGSTFQEGTAGWYYLNRNGSIIDFPRSGQFRETARLVRDVCGSVI